MYVNWCLLLVQRQDFVVVWSLPIWLNFRKMICPVTIWSSCSAGICWVPVQTASDTSHVHCENKEIAKVQHPHLLTAEPRSCSSLECRCYIAIVLSFLVHLGLYSYKIISDVEIFSCLLIFHILCGVWYTSWNAQHLDGGKKLNGRRIKGGYTWRCILIYIC